MHRGKIILFFNQRLSRLQSKYRTPFKASYFRKENTYIVLFLRFKFSGNFLYLCFLKGYQEHGPCVSNMSGLETYIMYISGLPFTVKPIGVSLVFRNLVLVIYLLKQSKQLD